MDETRFENKLACFFSKVQKLVTDYTLWCKDTVSRTTRDAEKAAQKAVASITVPEKLSDLENDLFYKARDLKLTLTKSDFTAHEEGYLYYIGSPKLSWLNSVSDLGFTLTMKITGSEEQTETEDSYEGAVSYANQDYSLLNTIYIGNGSDFPDMNPADAFYVVADNNADIEDFTLELYHKHTVQIPSNFVEHPAPTMYTFDSSHAEYEQGSEPTNYFYVNKELYDRITADDIPMILFYDRSSTSSNMDVVLKIPKYLTFNYTAGCHAIQMCLESGTNTDETKLLIFDTAENAFTYYDR